MNPRVRASRKTDRPIRIVILKIAFRADRKTAALVRRSFPSAKVHNGLCEVKIESERPAEAAEKARELLEKIRSVA